MNIPEIRYDEKGLVPAIVQDMQSGEVLMMAYMNREALEKTLTSGKAHYYSRSRQTLWLKGETSGHFQHVKKILYDCDQDALLLQVEQIGEACHTGNRTCFYRSMDGLAAEPPTTTDPLSILYNTIINRRDMPREGSYTRYLFEKGLDKMLKKVGEECAEVIIAAKNRDKEEQIREIADLMYHLSVAMAYGDVTWDGVYDMLKKRRQ